jgi:hypothetical protein
MRNTLAMMLAIGLMTQLAAQPSRSQAVSPISGELSPPPGPSAPVSSELSPPSGPSSPGAGELSPPSQGGARGGLEHQGAFRPAATHGTVRFEAIDIYIDSADQPLAAYQFELLANQSPERKRGVAGETPAHQSPERQRRVEGETPAHQSPERQRRVEGDNAASQPDAPDVKIVGVEGGDHTAFREPPYYDPAALSHNRIIIAAFNTGRDLPKGKTRVARLHLQISGPEPQFKTKLDVAASAEGKDIPATSTVEPGVTR